MAIEIGEKYNNLLVLQFSHKIGYTKYYLCQCDCGNTKIIAGNHILSGHTKTCGCLKKTAIINRNKTLKRTEKQTKRAIDMGSNSGKMIRQKQIKGIKRPDNTSGVTGVSYDINTKRWKARLQYKNKSYCVRCSTFEEAVLERKKLEKKLEIYKEDLSE